VVAKSAAKFPPVSKGFAGFEFTSETGQTRQNPTFPVSVSFHINLPSGGKYQCFQSFDGNYPNWILGSKSPLRLALQLPVNYDPAARW
jgi:hypothetical protein